MTTEATAVPTTAPDGGTLDISRAQGAYTGKRYVESLRDGREVWLNGEKVKDVTTHPAFAGVIREFCRLYDLQHSPEFRDLMTFVSPETGNRVSYSWLVPHDGEGLRRKRRNSEIWMEQSWGQLGRTPDFMAQVLVSWVLAKDQLARVNPMFGENVVKFHRYAMEHDLSLTHAIGDPQINRADVFRNPIEDPDMALRVVRETADGIIIRGAKQLATLAPIANEIMVYLSATFSRRARDEFVQWFSIPMSAPGLKIICREPLSLSATGHSLPFASRFDEQDAMVFFDDVLIPWERVFMLYDREAAVRLMGATQGFGLSSSTIRFYHRLQTYLGVTMLIAESIGVDGFPEVREKLGELVMYSEVYRLAMQAIHRDSEQRLEQGGARPAATFVPALSIFSAQTSARVAQILREVGGSGLIMQPSEADMANPDLRPYLDRYMHGAGVSVEHKSRLYRLGFDLTISGFANRQELYEYWHGGDPTRNRTNLYLRHDRSRVVDRLRSLISEGGSQAVADGSLRLTWGKIPAYLVDEWCRLLEADLGHGRFNTEGVYIVWAGSKPSPVLRVGYGRIEDGLAAARRDPAILAHELKGLYATWARVPAPQQPGVARYVAETLKPELPPDTGDAEPVEVNLPEW